MSKAEAFLKDLFNAIDESSKIIKVEDFAADDDFIVTLRIKLEKDFAAKCKEWMEKFQIQTNTKYAVRRTHPHAKRMEYRVIYYCRERNTKDCKSIVDLKVKVTSEHTKKRDPLIKDGYNTIVKVNFKHSHKR